MTYFGFLLVFLLGPLIVLGVVEYRNQRRDPPATFRNWSPRRALLGHVVVALIYTTPWDNYLIATRVWWYDPDLVTGIVLGWVPIEEYTFFVLQTLLTGLWILFLIRHLPHTEYPSPDNMAPTLRLWSTVIVGLLWLVMLIIWLIGWQPGTYLALELLWALPPIMLQLAFGADILWHNRQFVLAAIAVPTIFLSLADAVAIGSGTWTINPALSLEIYLGSILPVEELIFFLLTNTLVTFGMTLVMATASQVRVDKILEKRTRKFAGRGA